MSYSKIKHARAQLKYRLIMEQRKARKSQGYIAICPYCDDRVATDMHEALVKRGDVQSWPEEDRLLIYVRENCVVLCHECHMQHGQTTHMTAWFVEYRSDMDLEAWLKGLPFTVTPRLGYVGGHSD